MKKSIRPYMTNNEILLFKKYLLKSENYIEFGAGGSTLYAIENNIKNISTIETDLEWIKKIKSFELIKKKLDNNELIIKYLDLECTWWKHVTWSTSSEECNKRNWPLYSKLADDCKFTPDLILIDGRFRVATALESIKLMTNETYLLFHDYMDFRKQYYVIEKFFDKIEKIGKLQVFKKKNIIDKEELHSVIEEYRLLID